jgi:CubicO group peptidase (beta-lactamase class C family)
MMPVLTQAKPHAEPRSTRRRLLRGAWASSVASLAATGPLAGLSGCTTAPLPNGASVSAASQPSDTFRFEAGVGARAGGPELARYADARGVFPEATRTNWWSQRYSVDGFSRLGELLPSAVSRAGARVSPLRRADREPAVDYLSAGQSLRAPLQAYFDRNPVTGLMVLRDGEVLIERYQYARTPAHRFTSFSMAKTLIAAMVGLALEDGAIASIDDLAERYAPGLAGTEYGRTPLRHLLTMSSGVRFREDYDGQDDSARLSRAVTGGQSAGGADVVRPFNERIAAPGERWYYASAETFVLALALRSALRRSLADYFSERIWQPLGAQTDALWLTDRSGLEAGYMGFHATLPDYGRLAAMLAADGRVGTGSQARQILPSAWLTAMTRAQVSSAQTGRWFGYGYQTWVFPANDRSFALLGVRGQAIYVDPARRLAMVHTAVRPAARDPGGADATALWRGLLGAMRG